MAASDARKEFFDRLVQALDLAQTFDPDTRFVPGVTTNFEAVLGAVSAPVVLQVTADALMCAGQSVDGVSGAWLQRYLRNRRVGRVVLPPGASSEQVWRFLVVLSCPPDYLDSVGGAAMALREFGPTPIQIETLIGEEPALQLDEITLPPRPRTSGEAAVNVNAIMRALQTEPNRERRFALIDALVEIGVPAIPILRRVRGSWYVMRNVLEVLARIGDPSGCEIAIRLLSNNSPRVRLEAVRTLSRIPSEESFQVLTDLSGGHGKKAMRAVADPDVVSVAALHTMRLEAIRALGFSPGHRVVDVLERLLEKPDCRGDEATEVRTAAAHALASQGSTFAWRALTRASRGPAKVARIARGALETRQSTAWKTS